MELKTPPHKPSENAIRTAIVAGLVAFVLMLIVRVAVSGPKKAPPDSPAESVPVSQTAPASSSSPVSATPPAGSSAPLTPGPDGTVRVGNALCPVLGGEINPEIGFAYNGWWINECCPGCNETFAADLATFVPKLKQQTGIDVSQPPAGPAEAMPAGSSPAVREPGPEGTVKVGNALCPVLGGEINPEIGFAYNGWWINECCPGCNETFAADLATFVPKLKQQTGIDVSQPPASSGGGRTGDGNGGIAPEENR